MAVSTVYKECLVKCCKNNSVKTPEKYFIHVPADRNNTSGRRTEWAKVLGIESLGRKNCFVCEDHFDLKEDAINWMYFKTMGSFLLLKKHVVPHKNLTSPTDTEVAPQLSNVERELKDENLKHLEKLGVYKRKRRKRKYWIHKYREVLENKRKEEELEPDITETEAKAIINNLSSLPSNAKIIGTLRRIQFQPLVVVNPVQIQECEVRIQEEQNIEVELPVPVINIPVGSPIQPVQPLIVVEETPVQIQEPEERIKEELNIEIEELSVPVIDIKTEIKEEILDTPEFTTTASFEFVNVNNIENSFENES